MEKIILLLLLLSFTSMYSMEKIIASKDYYQNTIHEFLQKETSIPAILKIWHDADEFYTNEINIPIDEALKNEFIELAIHNCYEVSSFLFQKKLYFHALEIIEHIFKNYTSPNKEIDEKIIEFYKMVQYEYTIYFLKSGELADLPEEFLELFRK